MLHYKQYRAKKIFQKQTLPSGFALFEAVIAITLLAVATLVFLSIWLMASIGGPTQRLMVAHHVASKKIEELRQTNFDSLPPSGTFSDPALNELPGALAELSVSNYLGIVDMKHIKVTISWDESGGRKIYALDTVISRGASYPPPQ